MYTIEYYTTKTIHSIKDIWLELEKGKDMTYFQSYDWNIFITHYQLNNNFYFENIIYVVKDSGIAVLIAPLFLIKRRYKLINRKACYFLGRNGWSDYLNFIYKEFDTKSVDYLLDYICQKYCIHDFYFEQIKDNSEIYNYLVNRKAQILYRTNCVNLKLSNFTIPEYNNILSKNTRQNIRTAYNRIKKDGLKITINFNDTFIEKSLCESIRNERVVKKNIENNILKILKNKIRRLLSLPYPQYLPFYNSSNSKIISIYERDNLMAYFNYGIDSYHHTIVIMAVGTNEKYSRYSPGILLMHSYIEYLLTNKKYFILDFTRGNEKYKYSLGGKDHFIYNFKLTVNND